MTIRIKGLVRAFNMVRKKLQVGIAPEEVDKFKADIQGLLQQVKDICTMVSLGNIKNIITKYKEVIGFALLCFIIICASVLCYEHALNNSDLDDDETFWDSWKEIPYFDRGACDYLNKMVSPWPHRDWELLEKD